MSITYDHQSLLGFVHIEKAAGTTLTHILRQAFFLKSFEVAPLLTKSAKRIFRPHDLRNLLTINPRVKCIAGHAIKPWALREAPLR